jgi:hypothetical protein
MASPSNSSRRKPMTITTLPSYLSGAAMSCTILTELRMGLFCARETRAANNAVSNTVVTAETASARRQVLFISIPREIRKPTPHLHKRPKCNSPLFQSSPQRARRAQRRKNSGGERDNAETQSSLRFAEKTAHSQKWLCPLVRRFVFLGRPGDLGRRGALGGRGRRRGVFRGRRGLAA